MVLAQRVSGIRHRHRLRSDTSAVCATAAFRIVAAGMGTRQAHNVFCQTRVLEQPHRHCRVENNVWHDSRVSAAARTARVKSHSPQSLRPERERSSVNTCAFVILLPCRGPVGVCHCAAPRDRSTWEGERKEYGRGRRARRHKLIPSLGGADTNPRVLAEGCRRVLDETDGDCCSR